MRGDWPTSPVNSGAISATSTTARRSWRDIRRETSSHQVPHPPGGLAPGRARARLDVAGQMVAQVTRRARWEVSVLAPAARPISETEVIVTRLTPADGPRRAQLTTDACVLHRVGRTGTGRTLEMTTLGLDDRVMFGQGVEQRNAVVVQPLDVQRAVCIVMSCTQSMPSVPLARRVRSSSLPWRKASRNFIQPTKSRQRPVSCRRPSRSRCDEPAGTPGGPPGHRSAAQGRRRATRRGPCGPPVAPGVLIDQQPPTSPSTAQREHILSRLVTRTAISLRL